MGVSTDYYCHAYSLHGGWQGFSLLLNTNIIMACKYLDSSFIGILKSMITITTVILL